MDVDEAKPCAHQAVMLDEIKHFGVIDFCEGRQGAKQGQNFCAIAYAATGQFADDERMTRHFPRQQQRRQLFIPLAQVAHPH